MVEDVLNTMKAVIEDHIEGELGKQDHKFSDGIELDSIKQVVLGDDAPNEKGFPAVVLQCNGSETNLWATSKKDVTYIISIGVIINDTNETRALKKLWRTMRALENCFEIYLSGRDGIFNYLTTDMDFQASLFGIDETKNTMKAGVVSAEVTKRLDAYTSAQV